jgi:glycerol-3-phosphate acyltransferase PlsY
MLIYLIIFASAYLLGSISSAVLICKIFALPDPRTQGSKNPGATNVLRIAGRLPGALTLLLDGLKGFIALLLVSLYFANPLHLVLALVGVVIGHILPIFFKFQGGKGVATAYGAFLALDWMFGGIIILTWLAILKLLKISSLAALFSCLTAILLAFYWYDSKLIVYGISCVACLVIFRHKSNILRLITNKEFKVL